MRLLIVSLFFLSCPVLANAEKHEEGETHEESESGESVHALVELTPGVVLYGDSGKIKVEPALGLEIGVNVPLLSHFAIEGFLGYEVATTTAFDTILHGPTTAIYFVGKLWPFAIGVGPKAGLDYKKSSFEGGWIGLNGKFMVELSHSLEVGVQGGPRLQFSSTATKWGGDAFAVIGWVF